MYWNVCTFGNLGFYFSYLHILRHLLGNMRAGVSEHCLQCSGLVISTLCLSCVLYASRGFALSIVALCMYCVFCCLFVFLLPRYHFIPFSPLFPFISDYFLFLSCIFLPFPVYVQNDLIVCSICLFLYVFPFFLLFVYRILF